MSLSKNDTQKIAKLARIRLSDDETTNMMEELNSILNWIEQLSEVDTDGVPEMAGVGQQTLRWRKDEVTDGNRRDDILKNAPDSAYDCFKVPKVVE